MKISTTIKLIVLFGVLLMSTALNAVGYRYTYATALILSNSGVESIYNTSSVGKATFIPGGPAVTDFTAAENAINLTDFGPYQTISLGTYVANSGTSYLKLQGAEVRTWKQAPGSNCAARLQYVLYENNSKPFPLTYTPISLPSYATWSSGSTFNDGFGPCTSTDYVKWRVANAGVNLSSNEGRYSLEFKYEVDGSATATCNLNTISNNFKVTFTVTPTLSFNQVVTPLVCGTNGSILLNTVGIANGTYSDRFFCDDGQGGLTYFSNVVVSGGIATIPAPAGVYDNITYYGLSESNIDVSGDGNSIEVHDPTPPAIPIIDLIHQPSCGTATGSVDFSGLPITGNGTWTIDAVTGGVTTATLHSSGASATFSGLDQSTTYKFKVINSIGCVSSLTGDVSFNAQPESPVVANQVSTICSAGTFTVTPVDNGTTTILTPSGSTYSWGVPVAPGITGGATGSGAASISGTLVNTTTTNKMATYTVTPKSLGVGNCDGANFTVTVTVTPTTAISAQSTATQTQCISGVFTAITVTASGTGTLTYQWYSNAASSNVGGASLGAANGAQTASYTPPASVVGTTYYYCVVHSDCGSDATSAISGAFIVNPATTLNSQSTATQTQCINGAFTPITVTASGTGTLTYQWYSNTVANTTTGVSLLAANGAQTASYTPQATVVGTKYYYCVIHSDCGADVTSLISGALIVTTATTINSQSTATQTQCVTGAFTPITVTASGTGVFTYQWFSNSVANTTTGASLGAGNGAQSASYTPQASVVGTKYYYCIVHTDCGADATSAISGAFIVNPATALTSQSTATQTQCVSGTFTPITVTASGTGILTYQWYSNTVANTTTGVSLAASNGAQTASYTPQAVVAGTTYYYCVIHSDCGSDVRTAISGAFIVNPATTLNSQSTVTQTQCITGAFTPITVTAIGTGTLTYQWYSNTVASTIGGAALGAVNGAQTASYTPQALVVGTKYYYCEIHSDCGADVLSAVSGAFIVSPATALTSQSTATQTQCISGAFTPITVTAVGTGSLTYQWYSNAVANTTTGVSLAAANGAQTASYTPQASVVGTTYYYCVIHSDCGANVTSLISGAFIVNPATALSSQSTGTQTQCISGAFTPITVTASGTGTLTYQWYSNTVANTTTGISLAASNGARTLSYTPQTSVVGTTYYYCVIHSDCGADVTSAISGAFIVNPATAITGQSTATQTQCLSGTFTPITVTAVGTGTLTYQWYSNTVANTTTGTTLGAGNGAQTASYTPQALVVGTKYYYCIVHSDCGADVKSLISGAFIVNPATALNSQSTATQTQCVSGAFTPISVTAVGTGVLTYQWYSNAVANTTTGVSLGGANGAQTAIYTPQASVAGTTYYYCVIHSDCGTDVTSAVSGGFIVTPATALNSQSTATQTQCVSGAFTPITVTASGTGILTYQWFSNAVASNVGGVALGAGNGAQTAIYTPQALVVGTKYYYCEIHSDCGSDVTSIVSGAFIVNPATALTSQSTATQTQCISGAFTPITVTAVGSGVLTYQWYSNAVANTTTGTTLGALNGAQTSSYTPQASVAGTLYYYCVIHSDCGTDVTTLVSGAFIVNPATALNSQSTGTQTQCVSGAFTPITVTAVGTGVLTYQWYSNTVANTTTGVALGAANGARTLSYTPQASVVGTKYYYCVIHSDCGADVTSVLSGAFIVNSATTLNSQSTATQTQCVSGAFTPITVTAVGTGLLTYQWYRNAVANTTTGISLGGSDGAQTASYTPQALVVGTSYYYCVIHSDCGSDVTSFVSGAFVVNPATALNSQSTATQTQCLNDVFSPITVTAVGTGTLTYQWYSNPVASAFGGVALGAGNGARTAIYTPQASVVGTTYYYCVIHSDCGADVTSIISGAFIVNPATTLASQSTGTQTQCVGGGFTPISVTASGTGVLTYQWYSNAVANTTTGVALGALDGAQTASYTPQASVVGTTYYYCEIHSDCGSDVISAVSGAFIVDPATALIGQSTATQTQCISGAFTPITVTASGTGVLTYQWYSNAVANTTTGVSLGASDGAQTANYTPQTSVVGTAYYYCVIHSDCGADVTSIISGAFIVDPATTLNSQSTATQTQCVNGAFAPITVTAVGSGLLTYQWYSNTVANTTTGAALGAANGARTASYIPRATVVGTKYYYCVIHSDCGADVTSVISGAFIVNTATAINSQSTGTQTQCVSGAFTPISLTTTTGTGMLTYQWYSNTVANTTTGISLGALDGAQTASYTPQTSVVGTTYYYCEVHSDCGTDVTSAISGAFIVNPATAINSQSTATQTQCVSGAFTPITVTAVGTGMLTYQWYSNTVANTTTGISLGASNGARTANYTPQALVVGTTYYYCFIHSDCGADVTSVISGAFIVNQATALNSQSTATQTQCISGAFTPISVTASGTGVLTYQWFSNTVANTTTGTTLGAFNGAQTASYTPQASVVGTTYYYCEIHSDCGTDVTSLISGAFIVNPATTIIGQSTATQTQCFNDAFIPISVTAIGTGVLTYQWYSNTVANTTTGVALGALDGAQTAIYTPQSSVVGTTYYYCVIHSDCGADVTSAISGAFIVNPPTSLSSQSTGTQTQCVNGVFTPITVTASGTGVLTYQWYSNAVANTTTGVSLGAAGGAKTASYTPRTTVVGTKYYYCVIHSGCGTDVTSAVSGAFIVTPATVLNSQSTASQSQCLSGSFTPITVSAVGTGTLTYQWYSNTVANTTTGVSLGAADGAQTASYTPQALVVGSTYYYCVIHSDCSADVTSVVSGVFTVTSPTAINSQSTTTQTQCNNSAFTPITVTAVGTGVLTYQWYRNTVANTTTGTTLGGGNGAQTNSYTPQSTAAGTLYYYCIVHSDCGSDVTSAISAAFNVLPLPDKSLAVGGGGVAGICSHSGTNISVAASVAGVKYQLRNDNANELVGIEVIGNGGSIDLPTGILTTTTTFNVLAIDPITACSVQLTQKATVTVNDLPTISLNLDPVLNVCNDVTPTSINLVYTAQSADTYSIHYDLAAKGVGFADVLETAMIPSPFIIPVPHVVGGQEGVFNAILTVKHIVDGCTQDYPFTVTINPAKPSDPGAITGNLTPCSGATEVYSISAVTNPGSYNWSYPADWSVAATPGLQHSNSISLVVGPTSGTVSVQPVNACGASDLNSSIVTTVSASPAVNPIVGLADVCNGATGSVYHATTDHPANSYVWNVVGGTITSGGGTSTIHVTWNVVGAGTVDMTETAGTCPTVATQFAVTVHPLPTPVIVGADNACNGTIGSVYRVTDVPGNSYAWSVSGGTITSGNGSYSITVTWNVAGAGTVDVTETVTSSGCSTASAQKSVTVYALPNPIIDGAAIACNGTTGSAYNVIDVVGNTYLWSVVGGTITAGQNSHSITVTWNVPGAGTVDVVETISLTGCTKSAAQKTVTVNSLPTPVIGGPVNLCDGTTGSVYSVNNDAGNTYNWSVAGGNITAGTGTSSITVTWNTVGNGTVDVTETIIATGCSTDASQLIVTVNPLPTVVIGGHVSECVGTTASTYSVTNHVGNSYVWSVSGGTITQGQGTSLIQVTWTVVGAGTVDVTETVDLTSCSKAAAQKAVTIHPLPTPFINGSSTACANEINSNYNTTAVAGHSYSWSVVGGTVTAGGATNSINVTWNAAGAGSVDLVETINATGCANSAIQKTVTINALPTPSFTVQPGATACASNDVTYSTETGGGESNYIWVVPGVLNSDYSISSGGIGVGSNTVTLKWLTVGNKTVTISYTKGGCTALAATSSITTAVTALPTPSFTVQPGATACASNDVTYTTQTGGGESNYIWVVPGVLNTDYSISAGGVGVGDNTVTLKWLTSGNKMVTINYTKGGCAALAPTSSITTAVTALPTPSFTAQPGATACASYDVTYTTETGGGEFNYIWVVPGILNTDYSISTGGIGVGSNTVTLKWLTTGNKTVSINYTKGGCTALAATSSITTAVTALPTPSFTVQPGATTCASNDVTYTTETGNGESNYIWSVPGALNTDYIITSGGIDNASNTVTLKWLSAGNKTVTINYSKGGCAALAATSSITTNVTALPTPSFIVQPGANACASNDVTYTTQSGGGQSNYIWVVPGLLNTDYSISAGGIGLGSNTVTLKWLTAGNKTVTINYTKGGCTALAATSSITTVVTALPIPSFTVQPGATACASNDVTYTTETGGGESNYVWVVPGVLNVDYSISAGGIGVGSNTVTLKWLTAGNKTVTINYIKGGCTALAATSSVTTSVTALPTPSFTVQPGATACASNDVTYTTQAGGGESNYIWSVPGLLNTDYSISAGGIGVGSNTVTLKWLTAGNKTVTINYTKGGCTALAATSSVTTAVIALPTPSFTVQPGATACASNDVTYTTQTGGGESNYIWVVPGVQNTDYSISAGGIGVGSNTVTLKWLTAGNKTVTINYTKGSCTALAATSSITTAVTALPTPSFTVQPGATACASNDVTYTTETGGGESNYVWVIPGVQNTDYSISSGGIGVGSNTVTLKWLTAGNKTVTINYTKGSCTALAATSSITTAVTALPIPSFTVQPGATACASNDVTYTTLTGGGESNYIWVVPGVLNTDYSISAGGIGVGSNTVTLKWLTAGIKIVTINYTRSGCTALAATSSAATTVTALPTPSFTVQPGAAACVSNDVTYTTQNGGGESNYIWTVPGVLNTDYSITSGGIGIVSNTVTLKWLTSGVKIVTISYTKGGCTALAATSSIATTVSALPTPIITGSATACATETGAIYRVGKVVGNTYNWNVVGGAIASGAGTDSITINWSGVGVGSVDVIEINLATGCQKAAAQKVVTINPASPITPGIISGTVIQCPVVTGQVYSVAAVTNATTYTWVVPTGWTITAGQGTRSLTVTTGVGGDNGNITVTAGNSCGSSTAQSLAVQVLALPATPGAISGQLTNCPVASEVYSIAAVAGATTYLWTVPAGWAITSGNGSTSITVSTGTAGANGNVAVTAGNSCGNSSAKTLAVTVSTGPAAPIVGVITQPSCNVATGGVVLSGLPAGDWAVTRFPGNVATLGSGNSLTITDLLPSATYNFTVTNAMGCTSAYSTSVLINPNLSTPATPTISSIVQPTCNTATGTVVLNSLPGSGTWTLTRIQDNFQISGTGSSKTLVGLAAGTYTYTVTDANTCISLPSADIVINPQPHVPTAPITIKGGVTQCALVSEVYTVDKVANATAYTWNVPTGWLITAGQGSDTLTVTTGAFGQDGNITVTADNICGSSATQTLAVAISLPPTAPTVGAKIQPNCLVPTGSVTLNGLPAIGTWTLTTLPGGSTITGTGTSNIVSGLVPNTYTFKVTNAAGCISPSSGNVIITANASNPIKPTIGLVTQPSCAAGTGSVLLTGLPSGAWTINPGGISGATPSTTISNLAPGKYVYSVTDAGGCVSLESDTITINLQPLVPVTPGAITGQAANCPLTAEIYSIADVQFATTYTWTVPTGWTITAGQGTKTLTVKSGTAGQNGNVSVTAGNSCGTSPVKSLAVSVNVAPGAPSVGVITQPSCSEPNGTVMLNNLPAGNWTLNPGAIAGSTTSYKIFDLLPGSYNYTVTNAAGCNSPSSASVVITANLTTPSVPTVFAINQPSCSVPTGSASLGGLPAGNWTINPGAITGSGITKTLSGLLPGTYSYTVTNASGCTSLPIDVVINGNANTPTAPLVDLVSQPSGGIITGSVDLSGLPTGNWTLKRLPDNVVVNGTGTSTTVSSLTAGTYNFVVTNAAGCVSLSSDNVLINPPAPVALGVISGLAIQCPAATAQGYSVVAIANATSYTWVVPASWSITAGQGTNSIQVTTGPTGADGNITVTAGNINGNSAPQILAVQVFGIPITPTSIVGTTSNCPASSEVYSVAPVAGANTYTWTVPTGWVITNGNGTSSITVSTGAAGQNGNVTVSAGNDCGFSAVKSYAVTVSTPPTAPVAATLSQPNCNVATGGVVLSGLPVGNWVLTRFPGNVATPGTGASYAVTGLSPAATYNFIVSNSNGCISPLSADVVIDANASTPSAPMVSSIVQPTCAVATGRVMLSALPAVGTWTLTRTPGSVITNGTGTTKTITNLNPGTYTYIVSDASGCVSLVSENIVIDAQPQLPVTPAVIKGGAMQCAAAAEIYSVDKVTDATTYTWTVPAGWSITSGQGTDSIAVTTGSAGQSGNVTVTANSVCGSSAPQALTVQISTPPNAPTVGAKVQPSCPIPTGSVTLNNLPAVGTWTLTRMPDGVTKTGNGAAVLLTGLAPNTYTYTVTNAAGCTSASSVSVVIIANPSTPAKPLLGLITQPSCGVATGKVVLSGLPLGSWTINPGAIAGASSSTTLSNLAAGKYNFSVTDVNGCVSLMSDTVTILPQPFTPVIPGVITGSISNCAAQVEVYTIDAVPNATTYTWSVPTGWAITSGQGTTSLTVKTGAASQNGNISVTAGNACGTSAAKVLSVSVSVAPTAPTIGLRTQPTCSDPTGTVVLNGLPAGDWEINPGAIKGMTTMYKIYDLLPGTYNFTVTNSAGCTSPASASVIINANASVPTTPTFIAVTQPTCAVATGTVSLAGLPTGIWTINPGAIVGTGSTKSISGLLPGNYSFTVTNASTCTSLSVDTVIKPNVNTPSTPIVGAISQPTCTVFTGSVVLSDLPTGNWNITRLPDNKTTNGVGTSTTISGLDPGTYNFKVANSMGCVSLVSDNVLIDAVPVTPSAPIIQSVIQPTCQASIGTVILSGLPATGSWTLTRFPEGVVKSGLNSSNATITDLSPGTYSFMVTNSVGCNSVASASVVLNPASLPAIPIVSFVAQPTLSVATGTISFSVQNGVEYSINGKDFQSIAVFNGVNPGTYTLTVRKAADHTCTADALSKVTLSSVGPKASADFVKVNENDSIKISVLANDDFGQDPPKATPIVATNGLHGTVTVLDNGTPNNQRDDKLLYIPEAYYDGPDSFTYTICSENGMCSTATVDVTVADIDQLVAVIKKVTKPELKKEDGTYWLTYSIVVKNKTANIISQLQVVDDLSKTFLAPVTYEVKSVNTSRLLHQNSQYDGKYDLNILVGDGQLLGNQSDSILIVVQINPNGYTGMVYNQALMSGISADGPMYNVRSDDGSMQLEPKKTESALSAIKLVAPAAFTPNGDGLNDKYVILHSSVLRVKFQVFNRWGSIVYKSDDYQNDWDGKGIGMYNNQDLPNGTYYYVIEMVNGQTGEVVQKNGYLSLKR